MHDNLIPSQQDTGHRRARNTLKKTMHWCLSVFYDEMTMDGNLSENGYMDEWIEEKERKRIKNERDPWTERDTTKDHAS